MKNTKSYLIMKEFNKTDSEEAILEKLKDMFEINQGFVNMNDEEEYFTEDESGNIYKSQLEELFYIKFKSDMELIELKNLIDEIGNYLVDFYDEECGDFNIVFVEGEDKITIAISLCIYFI